MKKVLIMTGSMNVGGIEKALVEMLKVIPLNRYELTLFLEEKEGVYLSEVPVGVKIDTDEEIKTLLYSSRANQLKNLVKRGKLFKAASFCFHYLCFAVTKNQCKHYDWQCKNLKKLPGKYDIAIAYHNPFRFPGSYVMNNVSADIKVLWNHTDLMLNKVNHTGFEDVYKKYDWICHVSKAAEESLHKIFPSLDNKNMVFYNVINNAEIEKKATFFDIDAPKDKTILVTVGRLSPEKGQNRIPDIAKILKDRGVDFIWYIVGGGVLSDEIESKAKQLDVRDSIILTGNQPNPYPYLKACDIYVQTSWQEGFPMVIGEVLTFNKPCVVTDVGGTTEYFEKHDMAIVAENNTENCIANGICRFIEDKNYYNLVMDNIRKRDIVETDKIFDYNVSLWENKKL